MKRQGTVSCILIAAFGLGLAMAQDQKAARKPADARVAGTAPARTDAEPSDELAALRAVGESFLGAYRAVDATALGALSTENAEIGDDEGEVTRGRPAIVERFAGGCAANEGGKLEIAVDSIHQLSPGVAVEEGTATVSGEEGTKPESSRYTVIYVKQDGRWLH